MIDLATSLPPVARASDHPLEPAISTISRLAGPAALLLIFFVGLSTLLL
jgi:hypothetical protein